MDARTAIHFVRFLAGGSVLSRPHIFIAACVCFTAVMIDAAPTSAEDLFQITTDPASDQYPSWSPDGSLIAFDADRAGNRDIWVMPRSGGPATRITTDPGDDVRPTWSPDGAEIAFCSRRSGNRDIWVIPSTGGEAIQITFDPAADDYPAWSPDGRWIAFDSERAGSRDIWIIPAAGGTPQQITSLPYNEAMPAWSPHSDQLALCVASPPYNADVYTVSIAGGGRCMRSRTSWGRRAIPLGRRSAA